MISENQLLYSYNAKRSRELCKHLERLIDEADFHEKMLNADSHQVVIFQLSEVKQELNTIWDEQVELFFTLRDEHKVLRNKVFMESIRPNFKKSNSSFNQKDY